MPQPLPEGSHFYIKHRLLPADYQMPFLQMNRDFYSMGYHIQGDRTTVTPTMTYTQHPGSLGTVPPLRYHQTFPASDAPYESILLKFDLEFVKPFTDRYGMAALDAVYACPSNRFDKNHEEKISRLLFDMIDVYDGDSPFREFTLQCMLFQLFEIIMDHRLPQENAVIYQTALSKEIMESICYLESHYDESFSMDTIAEMAGFSTAHFSRVFKSQTGKTYSEYLTCVRIGHAESLLLGTEKTVTQIALETGFSYASKLTERFKKKTGMTPLEYRRQCRHSQAPER